MKKNKYELKSRNLILTASDSEKPFDAHWDICLNDPGLIEKPKIGEISFEGEHFKGTIPIKIEIFDKCNRNRGFGTEAIEMMTDWAFDFRNIFEITAVSEHENSAYIMALQKAGYVLRKATRETEYYSIVKQKTAWSGLYLLIGVLVGFVLGFLLSNGWVGLGVGVLSCLIIGTSMDLKEKKYRESVLGRKD